MKRVLIILLMFVTFSAMADEKGEKRLERISRYYAAKGSYSVSFDLKMGEQKQEGILMVDGNSSYVKIADVEVYIADSLRYEVRGTSKEIVVDKADLYENELLNPLKGLSKLSADYEIEERIVNGSITISLVPKQSGEVMSIEVAADGESISKVRYGGGDAAVEMNIKSTRKIAQSLPRFSKERYEGYEIIDFR